MSTNPRTGAVLAGKEIEDAREIALDAMFGGLLALDESVRFDAAAHLAQVIDGVRALRGLAAYASDGPSAFDAPWRIMGALAPDEAEALRRCALRHRDYYEEWAREPDLPLDHIARHLGEADRAERVLAALEQAAEAC